MSNNVTLTNHEVFFTGSKPGDLCDTCNKQVIGLVTSALNYLTVSPVFISIRTELGILNNEYVNIEFIPQGFILTRMGTSRTYTAELPEYLVNNSKELIKKVDTIYKNCRPNSLNGNSSTNVSRYDDLYPPFSSDTFSSMNSFNNSIPLASSSNEDSSISIPDSIPGFAKPSYFSPINNNTISENPIKIPQANDFNDWAQLGENEKTERTKQLQTLLDMAKAFKQSLNNLNFHSQDAEQPLQEIKNILEPQKENCVDIPQMLSAIDDALNNLRKYKISPLDTNVMDIENTPSEFFSASIDDTTPNKNQWASLLKISQDMQTFLNGFSSSLAQSEIIAEIVETVNKDSELNFKQNDLKQVKSKKKQQNLNLLNIENLTIEDNKLTHESISKTDKNNIQNTINIAQIQDKKRWLKGHFKTQLDAVKNKTQELEELLRLLQHGTKEEKETSLTKIHDMLKSSDFTLFMRDLLAMEYLFTQPLSKNNNYESELNNDINAMGQYLKAFKANLRSLASLVN